MQYKRLVKVYEQLESTAKRLEKTYCLSEFLKKIPSEELNEIMLLVQGRIFPVWDSREIGVASRLLLKAISLSAGITAGRVEEAWKQAGDLGIVAETLIKSKKQETLFSAKLTTSKVLESLRKLSTLEGSGTVSRKTALISELLTSASPLEAKYIVKTILGTLRIGLGEGVLRDAVVWAFFGDELEIKYDKGSNELIIPEDDREKYNKYAEAVQEAFDIVNDFSTVAETAKKYGLARLKNIALKPGAPLKVMLFQKAVDFEDAFSIVGLPCAVEFKFDGFRMQLHKFDSRIIIFTRRLEDVTKQFPEVVKAVKEFVKGESFILDAEAVGYDVSTKKYLPFQSISRRIKRKYGIDEMSKKFPVEVNVFDIIFYNGKSLIKTPFSERRKTIGRIVRDKALAIKKAEQIITKSKEDAEKFYKKSLGAGNEGVMLKNLQGIYKPGSRVGYGVKLKPVMETLDVVIVRAEWGEGKRSNWLSSYTIACRDSQTGELLEIGKVSTGLKEKEEEGITFSHVTELLKPLIIEEIGKEVIVKPKVVLEISFEEIQKSPTYGSGFALRFPRFTRLREDRGVNDISTLDEVKKLFKGQRGR